MRAFPRIIGWVLHTLRSGSTVDFAGDKDRIFDVFDKLQRYCDREQGFRDVAGGIEETAWAPILYWSLMDATTQDQIDTMFDLLVQMCVRQFVTKFQEKKGKKDRGGRAGWPTDLFIQLCVEVIRHEYF